MPVPELHRRFTLAEVRPPPGELATVLGYPGGVLPEVVAEAVAQLEGRGEALWSIEGGCLYCPRATVDRSRHLLEAEGLAFQVGEIVGGQLSRATGLAIFLCTAGEGIEDLSRRLMAEGDPFTAYVADTMGSLVVEAAVDRLEAALQERMAARGLRITNRYSPGYCEWHVSEQQKLFRLLPPGYCGVQLTESSLMRPMKTVSGVIGVGPEVRRAPYTCSACPLDECLYRRLAERRPPSS